MRYAGVGCRVSGVGAVLLTLLSCATGCAKTRANSSDTRHPTPDTRILRVCADPNNLPYSNEKQQGFENAIASLIARDLNARVAYTWFPQRRGFVRQTLRHGDCDVIMGIPSNFDQALPTTAYYRSTYVFVTRSDRHLGITSFDDPRLTRLHIGVQMIGNDHVNSPPAHALAKRGIIDNVAGYTVYGDYRSQTPGRDIVDAVANGKVDVAVVWGPQAGYFARQENVALDIVPVSPQIDLPFLPFVFDISMGVRRGDNALRDQLDQEIEKRRADIERILDHYGVPRV
ncbi:MAG: substrate-binding domain-containing protein [Acidobacteria bacterium]|nr:substrate-binding domain-containing protein [Acidobacteriota bacterium]MBV9070438.1 substrate-binding domain-containing protein [Acidobacteriota bacterium]MBV9187541.1 substrate-binding domain-containing protein [Acidobacteriota bacterium]